MPYATEKSQKLPLVGAAMLLFHAV